MRHALEAESECTAHIARADEYRGSHEGGAHRRAVVVHIRDQDARQVEVLERHLARDGFAEDVADKCRLDGIVRDS